MPYVFFVPKAKPRDTKHTMCMISIRYFNKEHILNAQSEAEAIFFFFMNYACPMCFLCPR